MTSAPDIRLADDDPAIRACHPVMVQLRPHVSEDDLVRRVRVQGTQGYSLVALYRDDQPVAVAGFRRLDNLAWGKAIYVDDLVTDAAARSQGHGETLLDWIIELARREGCAQLHLDSGVQRFEAHRFYLRKRMTISSHHFALIL